MCPCGIEPRFCHAKSFLRKGKLIESTQAVALRRDGDRRLFDAADLPFERSHPRAKFLEPLRPFGKRSAFVRLLIEGGNAFFPSDGGIEGGECRLFLRFENFEACSRRRVVLFGHFLIGFETRLSELAFPLRRGITGVRALDEPVAVFFEVEQAGDELQSICPRGADELRKFPLREGDAFFEIALFEPDDALQKRVALPHPIGNDDKFLVLFLIYFDGLSGVLAFELALDAEDAALSLKRDLERKMHICLFEGEVDDVADAARTRTGDIAVKGKADAV